MRIKIYIFRGLTLGCTEPWFAKRYCLLFATGNSNGNGSRSRCAMMMWGMKEDVWFPFFLCLIYTVLSENIY